MSNENMSAPVADLHAAIMAIPCDMGSVRYQEGCAYARQAAAELVASVPGAAPAGAHDGELLAALLLALPRVESDMRAAVKNNFGYVGNDPWANVAVDARDAVVVAIARATGAAQ